ncbi:hypothetical protein BJX66DRAFT_170020 [Aspergillus keveii]|uniref:Integral membrane protein n=1 Tax=Aspergillus keveii TaxID=714993 RepID=A0ABR4G8Q6_9EURO
MPSIPGTSGTSGSWPFASRSLPTLFYLTLAFSSSTLAQDVTLLPSAASASFPACGLTCTNLIQADAGCTPPTVAVTNQQTYVSCFCQSALLANLQTSPWGTCDTCTTQSDSDLLQSWYSNFCANGGNTEDTDSTSETEDETEDETDTTTGNTNSNSNNNSNNADNTNTTAAADTTATSSPAAGSRNNPQPQSWWDGHYQWVIMVIVLVIGFSLIAAVGIWLKKRHDAKHPNLYHGHESASGSRVFSNRNFDSPVPGSGALAPGVAAPRHESMNTVSIASSSRTNVIPTRPGHVPSRLQKPPQGVDDIEIREAPR